MINVAIIGFGLSGRYLQAPFFESSPLFNLHSIVTATQNPALYFNNVQVQKNIDAVLQNNKIDVVSICTPNNTHVAYAIKALQAGKHVLVEKPFTPTLAEAEALIELAFKQNKVLAVFQNRRFDSDFLTLQQVLSSKVLGNISHVQINYNRYKPELNTKVWKETIAPASGIIYDLGSHIIDQTIALFGKPLQISGATFIERKNSLIDDAFNIQLDYGQTKVTLQASLLVQNETPRYEVHGSNGNFVKFGLDMQEDQLKAGLCPTDIGFGIEPLEQQGQINITVNGLTINGTVQTANGNWAMLFNNFYHAIVNNEQLLIPVTDVLEQIKIIEIVKNGA